MLANNCKELISTSFPAQFDIYEWFWLIIHFCLRKIKMYLWNNVPEQYIKFEPIYVFIDQCKTKGKYCLWEMKWSHAVMLMRPAFSITRKSKCMLMRHHQMETFSALLALCEGRPWVTDGFPSHRPGQWRGPLMSSLIWDWTNGWAKYRDAGDLRHHRPHYNVPVMYLAGLNTSWHRTARATICHSISYGRAHIDTPVITIWEYYVNMIPILLE